MTINGTRENRVSPVFVRLVNQLIGIVHAKKRKKLSNGTIDMRWFKHMTNARNDEVLSEMVELYGAESYGMWWIILELIGAQMDKTDKCSARYSVKKWAKSCGLSTKKFVKTVSFLSKLGKISTEFCENNSEFLIIECRTLLKYRDEYTKKSRHTPDNIPTVSGVTPDQEAEAEAEAERQTKLFEKAFEKWWLSYPKRSGRRIGKKDAKKKFMKMPQSEWTNLNTATINYSTSLSESGLSPSDAHRFLNETWKEYIEKADKTSKGQPIDDGSEKARLEAEETERYLNEG